jgi:hypothetical protein
LGTSVRAEARMEATLGPQVTMRDALYIKLLLMKDMNILG